MPQWLWRCRLHYGPADSFVRLMASALICEWSGSHWYPKMSPLMRTQWSQAAQQFQHTGLSLSEETIQWSIDPHRNSSAWHTKWAGEDQMILHTNPTELQPSKYQWGHESQVRNTTLTTKPMAGSNHLAASVCWVNVLHLTLQDSTYHSVLTIQIWGHKLSSLQQIIWY